MHYVSPASRWDFPIPHSRPQIFYSTSVINELVQMLGLSDKASPGLSGLKPSSNSVLPVAWITRPMTDLRHTEYFSPSSIKEGALWFLKCKDIHSPCLLLRQSHWKFWSNTLCIPNFAREVIKMGKQISSKHMRLVAYLNPSKIKQSWERTFLKLYTHMKTK